MKGLSIPRPGSPGGILLFLVFWFLVSGSAVSESATINKRAQPGWVTDMELPPSEPSGGVGLGGVEYLLYDIQTDLRGAKTRQYFRVASQIRNEEGLRELSSLSVAFDPDYESLSFHSLRIHRGDLVIDRLDEAQFQILQRESNLERQIYDGSLTAHLILEDLRVGDLVEYSYSLEGNNPVFDGLFSGHYSLQWQVPVLRHRLRFLTDEGSPLHIQPSSPNFRFTRTAETGTVEYVLRQEATEARPVEGGTPSWYRPLAHVSVSQFQSWEDVQQWAAPLYAVSTPVSEEVREIAETIAQQHQAPEQRLQAALDFVQREIRYVGIEVGAHSYQPRPPEKVLQRRFGDCKDKTLLLNTLLGQMGITAHPVLVNTDLRHKVAESAPSPFAFDHVITQAHIGDSLYWVDGTNTHQRGALNRRTLADYGAGLVLDGQNNGITPHYPDSSTQTTPRLDIEQKLFLEKDRDQPLALHIKTQMSGDEATTMRGRVAQGGDEFQQEYIRYYESLFPELEVIQKPAYVDRTGKNQIVIDERYRVADLWSTDEGGFTQTLWLEADQIDDFAVPSKDQNRSDPYHQYHPITVQQKWVVQGLDESWSLPAEHEVVDNPYFRYEREVSFNSYRLEVTHRYQSKTDFVPAQDITRYNSDIEKLKNLSYYGLQEPMPQLVAEEEDHRMMIISILAGVLFLLVLLIIIDYIIDRRREKKLNLQSHYYPVSATKFIALGVITLGLYQVFWGYRNWRYISERDSRNLWSWVRGLFIPITCYGLFAHARNNAVGSYHLPLAALSCALLAIAFFVLSLIQSADQIPALLMLVALILGPLCLLPLQNYVNRLPENREAFAFNSRWRLRHAAAALIFSLIMGVMVAEELRIIPSDQVVSGEELPADLKLFLSRQSVIGPQEEILKFYSDALWDFRQDGNALTNEGVFSYWQDNTGGFQFVKARYEDIADLEVKKGGALESTMLKVFLKDGSFFWLVLSVDGDESFVKSLESRLAT
ncbi:DUF3857 domain-containing transglutaminase family protein [Marinobacter salsuginis]|uniref:DUF3857 domain-containing transglutaminase family protein n=1 Tax=Marinobacter salsuginis TaxID=418719 RepID=UPI00273E1C14|nr:DUF3857 domain-containing transglutaminase family protein [Marinobacter salsuginis]